MTDKLGDYKKADATLPEYYRLWPLYLARDLKISDSTAK